MTTSILKNKTIKVALLIIAAVMTMAASCDSGRAEEGAARDTIFAVDKAYNGGWGVFLTHDDDVVYCTHSDEQAREANNLLREHDGEVVIIYTQPKWFEDTEGEWGGISECPTYSTASSSGYSPVVILDMWGVNSRK